MLNGIKKGRRVATKIIKMWLDGKKVKLSLKGGELEGTI